MKKVLIVGGGFAGLTCAQKLSRHKDVHITLIDRHNYQQFHPLLYQVACALLAPNHAAFALRGILYKRDNVDVKLADIVSADLATGTVHAKDGKSFQGDYLVLATGSQPNFFQVPGVEEYCLPLYSLRDAEKIQTHLLAIMEAVDREPSLADRGALNFVIIGAGTTGTEISGTLADLLHYMLQHEYKNIDLNRARVHLVEKNPSPIPSFSEKSQHYAIDALRDRNVQLHFNSTVKEVTATHVQLSDGSRIPTRTVVWAGGLQASSLAGKLGIAPGAGGRIDVNPDFSLPNFPNVFVLGDMANMKGEDGTHLPQLAAVAKQAGEYCAKHIADHIDGKPGSPFKYHDKGIMAIIGRGAAVAEVGKKHHHLTGPLAFAAWLGVHTALLTTARARAGAILEWAWDYFAKVRGDQILYDPTTSPFDPSDPEHVAETHKD